MMIPSGRIEGKCQAFFSPDWPAVGHDHYRQCNSYRYRGTSFCFSHFAMIYFPNSQIKLSVTNQHLQNLSEKDPKIYRAFKAFIRVMRGKDD